MSQQTYNDNPVVVCDLGREQWRTSILQQIIYAQPPKVLGIHGTWGTGKTSLMAQMYTDLGGDHVFKSDKKKKKEREKRLEVYFDTAGIKAADVQPIWFEAWQYQHEPNILAALLKEIRDQLSLIYKIKNIITEDAYITVSSLLQSISLKFEAFGVNFGFGNLVKNAKENIKEVEQRRRSAPLDAVLEKKLLQEAVDQLLSLDLLVKKSNTEQDDTKKRKAVIFIDDLDRCMPETAFRILESIKVYLNLDNCIFVLGLDLQQIEHILMQYHERQFSDATDKASHLKNISRLYFEKICQDVYHLPMPNAAQKLSFFKQLLTDRLGNCQDVLNKLLTTAEQYEVLPPFPRSIKIWANVIITYCTRQNIQYFLSETEEEEHQRRIQAFLIFTYLYAFHFELYQLCVLYPDFYNTLFLEYCNNPFSFEQEKGSYDMFKTLMIPADFTDTEQQLEGKSLSDLKSDQLKHKYPDRNFRRVLWIGRLVKETAELDTATRDRLRMNAMYDTTSPADS